MKNFEDVYVSGIGDLARYVNLNTETLARDMDKLAAKVASLSRANRTTTMICFGLCGIVYLRGLRIKNLELKVKNLESIDNFMKDESTDDAK